MDQTGATEDHPRAELARTVSRINELTEWRFTLPGGAGDAVLRDQVEELQVKANRLCIELGEPELYPAAATGTGQRTWLGWVCIAVVTVAVLLAVWVMF